MRRSTEWTLEQVSDAALQDGICRQPDRVADALGLEELVHLGIGESRVAAKIEALHSAPIARHDRLQNVPPAISRMDVSGPQGAALQIAKLVEHKQRVIAGEPKWPLY